MKQPIERHSILATILITLIFLASCKKDAPPPVSLFTPEPELPITNDDGETLSTQPNENWVLLSGVDEHGLIQTAVLQLMSAPDAALSGSGVGIRTGTPAQIEEIRYTGPQNLHVFYKIKTQSGVSGWISDYYIRRVAYLFNFEGTSVTIYAAPDKESQTLITVGNVTPVWIKDPTDPEWWLIQLPKSGLVGWVRAPLVKESSDPQFLIGGGIGDHHATPAPNRQPKFMVN